MNAPPRLERGAIRVDHVSRRFKLASERRATLKEALIRRDRPRHSEIMAVNNVSFSVSPGDAIGLIGRNGSGKSTLLKMLAGIVPPHEGSIEMGGSVAAMLELGAGFHPDFTGRENVFMSGAIHGLTENDTRRRLDEIISFAELEQFIDMPVRTYSSGMQMRLAFAVAAHVDPDIMLLDEVLAVGDEAFQRKCLSRIYSFRRGGGTLVFVSHDAAAIEHICNRVILLDKGVVQDDGDPVQVMERYHRLLAEDTSTGSDSLDDRGARREREEGTVISQGSSVGWGTFDAIIRSVRLTSRGEPVTSLVSGDPLLIELVLDCPARLATPNIGVSIDTPDGVRAFGTNTRLAEFSVDYVSGVTTVAFDVPNLPFHEGVFEITVAVTSQDENTVYHWIDRAASLSVYSRVPGVGIARVEGTWSLAVTDPTGSSVDQPPSHTR